MSSYSQLYSHLANITTTTAAMDEDISISSSDQGVPTPSSSTQSPQPEPLHHAPESEMALESREGCPHGCNCASCQLRNRLDDESEWLMVLQACIRPASDYTPAAQPTPATPEEREVDDTMEPGTLEAARQHIAWLAAQLDRALGRAAQGVTAGMRPSVDDEWVINEAGRLLARVVPRMGAPSGAFSLDGGELYVIPDTFWPPPPRATPAGETDHSALARQRMEAFSSRVVRQLDAKKEEQLRAARPLEGDLSSPYQTKTSAEAESASTPPSVTEQEKQEQPQQQPQQPRPESDEFELPPESWESTLQKGLDLLDQEYERRVGPLVVSGSMAYRTAPEQKKQQQPAEPPVVQTPAAKLFSAFLEEQMDFQEQVRQRSAQLQAENGSKAHQVTTGASPPASTPTNAPEQQPPPPTVNANPSQTPEPATSTPETSPSRSINHPTADSPALSHACAVVQHHTDAYLYAHRDAIMPSSSSALQRLQQPTQGSSWQEEVHSLSLRQWAWAREHRFWVPPGGDIRLWAHATASVLYLPPPSDQDIFGY